MPPTSPLAYGPIGRVLVATDDRSVCVTPGGDDGPSWGHEAAAAGAEVL